VLGMPPAFNLSQNQTLRKKLSLSYRLLTNYVRLLQVALKG
jgi:hypothetical protein